MTSSPLGYQQLTVAGTAVGLTVPAGSLTASVRVETAPVRYRDDGTAPTASVGVLLNANDVLTYDGSLAGIQFIRTTSTSGVLDVTYYS